MAEQRLEITKGTKGIQTINVVHEDGSVYDLTADGGYTVTIYVWDIREGTADTNIVSGGAVGITIGASGICDWTYDFSADADALGNEAVWFLRLVSGDSTVDIKTRNQPMDLLENPWW